MDFKQNLLENWILGVNLVVDKTLRKLCKSTTSRDNDICYNCCLLCKAKAVQYSHCQQISAGKDRAKIRTIKKQRGKRVAYHLVLCYWVALDRKRLARRQNSVFVWSGHKKVFFLGAYNAPPKYAPAVKQFYIVCLLAQQCSGLIKCLCLFLFQQ